MDPLDVLFEEHEIILQAINVLNLSTAKLQTKKEMPRDFYEKLLNIITNFADKCHHGKEETALFPLIKLKDTSQTKNISILLEEHQRGRDYIAALKEAITSSNVNGKIENSDGYARLLTLHIQKETDLFPGWIEALSEKEKADLVERFEEIEAKIIGIGKHHEYILAIEDLMSQTR